MKRSTIMLAAAIVLLLSGKSFAFLSYDIALLYGPSNIGYSIGSTNTTGTCPSRLGIGLSANYELSENFSAAIGLDKYLDTTPTILADTFGLTDVQVNGIFKKEINDFIKISVLLGFNYPFWQEKGVVNYLNMQSSLGYQGSIGLETDKLLFELGYCALNAIANDQTYLDNNGRAAIGNAAIINSGLTFRVRYRI
jgi:hypothetical protein